MKSFSNLNQSQISALSSCSSNYNSRAESNSISHSVSSSNMSTSQQQRMIQNRVGGMQHSQAPFLGFQPSKQQSMMNSKQSQSASKNNSMHVAQFAAGHQMKKEPGLGS